jgi:dipeptidase E
MSAANGQIVAFGGGGFSIGSDNSLLDEYVLGLVPARRPRVCFLPTASGDADHYVLRFYRRFSPSCDTSHVSLFRRDSGVGDIRKHLLSRDLIYVGGGSVLSLLGAWRAHGVDTMLREAWEAGVILCGPSAGSLCWFAEGVTAFHGPPERVEGLGFLPWSNCVHFDAEPERWAAYRRMLADGMPEGYAVDDGAALHFQGEQLVRAVTSRPDARAYRVRSCGGRVSKRALGCTRLDGAADAPREGLSAVAA